MISKAVKEVIQHLTKADLDHVADTILERASNNFLDKALVVRLRTIEAKPLINALARAERLGYEPSDIVEDEGNSNVNSQERVQPAASPYPGAAGHAPQSSTQQPPPAVLPSQAQAQAQNGPQVLHCSTCFRSFEHESAYRHHVKHSVCTRMPNQPGGFKFSCNWCGQGFTTVVGLQYHNANKVCGDFGEPFKKVHGQQISGSAVPSNALATATPVSSRHTHVPGPATPASRPSPIIVGSRNSIPGSAGTPGVLTPTGGDPYAHLTPAQMVTMQEELRQAEIKYGERIRQAHLIPDDVERKSRLDALSNSFGTKQSLIRKKYGVRLRNRRTKAEIDLERARMGYRTAAELTVQMQGAPPGTLTSSNATPAAATTATPTPAARGWAAVNQPTRPPKEPSPDDGEVRMHGSKRARPDESSGDIPNRKRVAVADMSSGLLGSVADAETKDPTLTASAADDSETRDPTSTGSDDDSDMKTPTLTASDDSDTKDPALPGSDDSDDSNSDPDADIPALPASVRQGASEERAG